MSRVVCGSSMAATVASVSRASAAPYVGHRGTVEHTLHGLCGERWQAGQPRRDRVGVLEQSLVGHHSPGDAQREQSWCVIALAEEQHFAGLVEADEGRQQRGHSTGDEDVE